MIQGGSQRFYESTLPPGSYHRDSSLGIWEGPRWLVRKPPQTRGVYLASRFTYLPSPLRFELLGVGQYSRICLGHRAWKAPKEKVELPQKKIFIPKAIRNLYLKTICKKRSVSFRTTGGLSWWLYIKSIASLLLADRRQWTQRFKHCHSQPRKCLLVLVAGTHTSCTKQDTYPAEQRLLRGRTNTNQFPLRSKPSVKPNTT